MTTVTELLGVCRVQRLALSGGGRTWTVLGRDHRPIGPAEEYLEYLRAQRVSPNTVKSYARALAHVLQALELLRPGGAQPIRAPARRDHEPR